MASPGTSTVPIVSAHFRSLEKCQIEAIFSCLQALCWWAKK